MHIPGNRDFPVGACRHWGAPRTSMKGKRSAVKRTRPLLLLLGMIFSLPWAHAEVRAQTSDVPPNIIMIIGDDHGWLYSGFTGDEIVQTPTLDRLAQEGTVFTHGYSTNSSCRPALQTLLSGLHPNHWARIIEDIQANQVNPIRQIDQVLYLDTLPRRLREAGYSSFEAGKFWEGTYAMGGFDAGMADVITYGSNNAGQDFARPSIQALWDFLDETEDPFFLWLAPMLPHVPFDPPREFTSLYENLGLTPTALTYYANITRLDRFVDRVLEGLAERGIQENTLIIYVSDNGWEQDPYIEHWFGAIIGGSRGKFSNYELGFRTPIIFHWPGVVPAGERLSDLVSFEDLYATILDYGGVSPGVHELGISLLDRVHGEETPVRDQLFGLQQTRRTTKEEWIPGSGLGALFKAEDVGFARTDTWRYISFMDQGRSELYLIEEDPLEQVNLIDDYPEVAEELDRDLARWLQLRFLVPEPSAHALAAGALLSLAWLARRHRD